MTKHRIGAKIINVEGRAKGPTERKKEMKNIEMSYKNYKDNWSKCKTVKGSYDAENKTIVVEIPDKIYAMSLIIPAEKVDAYRAELIASGCAGYANMMNMMQMYVNDFTGAKVEDYEHEAEDVEWMTKAIEIANS